MFCNRCGTGIPDDACFCPRCGAPVSQADSQYTQPQYVYTQPMYGYQEDQAQSAQAKSVLTFGILSIAFSWLIALLGVVFGGIALGKANAYAARYPMTGKAKVGKILGIIGIAVGILNGILGVIFVFYSNS